MEPGIIARSPRTRLGGDGTQITEQVRDQVIPLDLCTRDTELRCHRVQLVGIHYFSPNRSRNRDNVVRIF